MYPRNAASPPRIAIGPVVQISDGAVQTSGCTVSVLPEGGAEGAGGGTVSYSTGGIVCYVPTQAETNYTCFILTAYKASCIPASVTVVTTASSTAGQVDVGMLGGAAQSLTDLKDFADSGYDPSSHKVAGVVLTDTCTTNTDMRGTDSAALASVCTETRLAELDAANLPTDIANVKTQTAAIETDTQDLQTQIGTDGAGLTAIGDTRLANLDATVSSRLAPAGTLATVTNLTNAPTNGDLTATMKASVTAAVPTAAAIGTDAASKVLATPAQKLVTDASGHVTLANGAQGGAAATLTLKSITVSNADGDAVSLAATGANGDGLSIAGNGSGHGMILTGGATGDGLRVLGGATSGDGIYSAAQTDGDGLHVKAAANGHGINADGDGSGDGIAATGGATGNGIEGKGGGTSGSGFYGLAVNGNGHGMQLAGNGSGNGLHAGGGETGNGIEANGGPSAGAGIYAAAAANNDAGMELVAHGTGDDLAADNLGSGSDPWSTALPGSYGAGTAGKILGDNLNATVSSRSSHSAADVATAVLATPAQKLVTDASGQVTVGTNADKTGYSLSVTPPTAADIKTAIEADGSKLDHLWETTEDDAGVRRFTENALEQAPSGTGGDATAANQTTILTAISTMRGTDDDTLKTLSEQLDALTPGSATNITMEATVIQD